MFDLSKMFVGIDVSKATLDFVARLFNGTYPAKLTKTIPNDIASITKHLKNFDLSNTVFLVEPTGTYSDKIFNVLVRLGAKVKIVHTLVSRRYAQLRGVTDITDEISARLLADMGAHFGDDLPDYQPLSDDMKVRKQLLSTLTAIEKGLRADENRLHALQQMEQPDELCIRILEDRITLFKAQKEEIEQKLLDLEKGEEYLKIFELITSVKGLAQKAGTWLMVVTGGFQNFITAKQVLKFLGLAPTSHRSGSSVYKKGGITKNGNNMVRGKLYMASMCAIQHNKACKELYYGLRERGKGHYHAITAVMCKLVKQAFAVVKSGIPFDNEYHLKFQKN